MTQRVVPHRAWMFGWVLVVVAAAGCTIGSRPLRLEGTEWRVVAVDGEVIPSMLGTRVLLLRGNTIFVQLACNHLSGTWSYDDDGSAIDIVLEPTTVEDCGPDVLRQQLESIRTALSGAMDALSVGEGDLELRGESTLRLTPAR